MRKSSIPCFGRFKRPLQKACTMFSTVPEQRTVVDHRPTTKEFQRPISTAPLSHPRILKTNKPSGYDWGYQFHAHQAPEEKCVKQRVRSEILPSGERLKNPQNWRFLNEILCTFSAFETTSLLKELPNWPTSSRAVGFLEDGHYSCIQLLGRKVLQKKHPNWKPNAFPKA